MNSIKLEKRMDNILMRSDNSKTSDPHGLSLLNLLDKTNFKTSDEYVGLSNLRIFYTWKNIKKSNKNKKFKMSPPWNEQFELPDESYFVLNIQNYFEYILKNMKQLLIILQ